MLNAGPNTFFKHKPATAADNDRLYPKVVKGDKAAIEEMILGNMALVTNKVTSYLEQFPQCNHFKDDLISAGHLGLTEAVNKMVASDVTEPNPTGFISVYIQSAIGELMDREAGLRVPGRTYRRKKKKGTAMEVPVKEASIDADHVFQQEALQDPRAVVDLLDEIMGCCETPQEREIVRLRIEGRKDDEVADILGLPKTTAYMLRRGIFARFLERNPEMSGEV